MYISNNAYSKACIFNLRTKNNIIYIFSANGMIEIKIKKDYSLIPFRLFFPINIFDVHISCSVFRFQHTQIMSPSSSKSSSDSDNSSNRLLASDGSSISSVYVSVSVV
mmetsp:Transcript_7514/g.8747  ORF Transcript_7514/g.8747 Transcript_7514/m.8747 type:complete len:108 (-) Transcript_7514:1205-1528(-)